MLELIALIGLSILVLLFLIARRILVLKLVSGHWGNYAWDRLKLRGKSVIMKVVILDNPTEPPQILELTKWGLVKRIPNLPFIVEVESKIYEGEISILTVESPLTFMAENRAPKIKIYIHSDLYSNEKKIARAKLICTENEFVAVTNKISKNRHIGFDLTVIKSWDGYGAAYFGDSLEQPEVRSNLEYFQLRINQIPDGDLKEMVAEGGGYTFNLLMKLCSEVQLSKNRL